MVILFSQYLRNVGCPFPRYRCTKDTNEAGTPRGWTFQRLDIFILLPVLLTIVFMWTLCAILTVTEALEPGSAARTDIKIRILNEAPWFRFPYPGITN